MHINYVVNNSQILEALVTINTIHDCGIGKVGNCNYYVRLGVHTKDGCKIFLTHVSQILYVGPIVSSNLSILCLKCQFHVSTRICYIYVNYGKPCSSPTSVNVYQVDLVGQTVTSTCIHRYAEKMSLCRPIFQGYPRSSKVTWI